MTRSQHMSLTNTGKSLSEETRQKISESLKGKIHSEETKQKISESMKGKNKSRILSEEIRQKYIGLYYWNDGTKCIRARECPGDEWTRGRVSRTRL